MKDQIQKNTVSMTKLELACEKSISIEKALGELLINAAAVIEDPVAMLKIAGAADKTYKEALEGLGLN